MMTRRAAAARGTTRTDWLDSRHSFSFGDYFDPANHHFRSLRVLNDDRIAAGAGFGMHPHRDMEILTFVLNGAIAHQDSMGHGETVPAGDWQYMSAGTGVFHSEFNPSETEPTHLLQIWIMPEAKGQVPRYDQKSFASQPAGEWTIVASRDGRAGSIAIRQDATLLSARLRPGDTVEHTFTTGRGGYLHMATGSATVQRQTFEAGDGAKIEDEPTIRVTAATDAQVLLFDLA